MDFIARINLGRSEYISKPHPTREEAAAEAFAASPKPRECSTCRAFNGRETHSDIRWHRREP